MKGELLNKVLKKSTHFINDDELYKDSPDNYKYNWQYYNNK